MRKQLDKLQAAELEQQMKEMKMKNEKLVEQNAAKDV
jgi:hypothetical protein